MPRALLNKQNDLQCLCPQKWLSSASSGHTFPCWAVLLALLGRATKPGPPCPNSAVGVMLTQVQLYSH